MNLTEALALADKLNRWMNAGGSAPEVKDLEDCIRSLCADIEELDRRIAELLQAVGLASTIKGDMEIDVSDPIGMMHKVVGHVDALRERCEGLELLVESKQATCDDLLLKLKMTNDDTKRINWLNSNGWAELLKHGTLRFQNDIRPAIDAALAQGGEERREKS